jgi:hypothetical protein
LSETTRIGGAKYLPVQVRQRSSYIGENFLQLWPIEVFADPDCVVSSVQGIEVLLSASNGHLVGVADPMPQHVPDEALKIFRAFLRGHEFSLSQTRAILRS